MCTVFMKITLKSLCLTVKHRALKTYGGVDVYIHVFLTWPLVGGEWLASGLCHSTDGEARRTHYIGGCVGCKVSLDPLQKRTLLDPTGN
jgi:hypothetical protein